MAENVQPPSAAASAPPPRARWNVLALYCYSHDGRRRDVELTLGAVNIITGHSRTGKSALAELIDYVMGSSECNLPGRVFDASAWVGVLWTDSRTQCFIARRIPERRPRGTDDFMYIVGAPATIPTTATDLRRTLNRDQMLSAFESLLGIGDVKTEVFGGERAPVRVSFRNAMPYLLQDASHINNRTALLRGMDGQQRQHLLDTLPYYLGVVDERTVARQTKLRQLRAEISAVERRDAERRAVAGDPGTMARALLAEAVDAGLAEGVPAEADAGAVYAALHNIATGTTEGPELFASDAALASLYERQQFLSQTGSALRRRIEATSRALEDAVDFNNTSDAQRQRLEVVELLPDVDDGTCPLCVQPLAERVEGPNAVRRAVNRVRVELADVARARPKLDGELAGLETQRAALARELQEVRAGIADVVRAADARERVNRLDRQRLFVVGRISLYLQTAASPTAPLVENRDELTTLRAEAEELAAELDPEAKRDALDVARTRLSALATEIAADLPFDPGYVGQPIDVNLRTLAVSVVTAREREEMRAIGSDENCQTLHLAVLLAFHRVFYERRRPVPGFLLLDQLSRPYYPPIDEEVEVGGDQPEVASLRKYFDSLFAEVARGEGLQILVLEHAYFSDDERFRAATRERWIAGARLIPADWPERK